MRWRWAPLNLKVSADWGVFVFPSMEMLHFSLSGDCYLSFWDLKGIEGMPRYLWNKKLTSVMGTWGGGSSFLLLSGETLLAI